MEAEDTHPRRVGGSRCLPACPCLPSPSLRRTDGQQTISDHIRPAQCADELLCALCSVLSLALIVLAACPPVCPCGEHAYARLRVTSDHQPSPHAASSLEDRCMIYICCTIAVRCMSSLLVASSCCPLELLPALRGRAKNERPGLGLLHTHSVYARRKEGTAQHSKEGISIQDRVQADIGTKHKQARTQAQAKGRNRNDLVCVQQPAQGKHGQRGQRAQNGIAQAQAQTKSAREREGGRTRNGCSDGDGNGGLRLSSPCE